MTQRKQTRFFGFRLEELLRENLHVRTRYSFLNKWPAGEKELTSLYILAIKHVKMYGKYEKAE